MDICTCKYLMRTYLFATTRTDASYLLIFQSDDIIQITKTCHTILSVRQSGPAPARQ